MRTGKRHHISIYVDDEVYEKIKSVNISVSSYVNNVLLSELMYLSEDKKQMKQVVESKSDRVNDIIKERDSCIDDINSAIDNAINAYKQINIALLKLELNTLTFRSLFEEYKSTKTGVDMFNKSEKFSIIYGQFRDAVIECNFDYDKLMDGNYPCVDELLKINPDHNIKEDVDRLNRAFNPCYL